MIKVYLDDTRTPPDGWVRVTYAHVAIHLLMCNNVSHLSLDHDLGDETRGVCGNGYDVLLWIEKEMQNGYQPPEIITVHSANVSARVKMEGAIKSIERFRNGNQ